MAVTCVDSLEMMAKTGISKVGALVEKFELGLSFYQDPRKPDCNGVSHHNQANGVKNSKIIVTGADDPLNDDAVNNEDVIAWNLCGSPKSNTEVENQVAELDDQNEELEAVNGEVSEQDSSGSPKSSTDVEDQVTESDDQDEKSEAVNGEVSEQDSSGSPKSSTDVDDQVTESDDQDEKLDAVNGEVSEQDLSGSSKSSTDVEDQATESDDQDEELDAVNGEVSEQDLSGSPKSNTEVEDQVAESDDQNEELDAVNGKVSEHLNEGDIGNMKWADDFPPLVNGSTLKDRDGFQVSSVNSLEERNRKTTSWIEVAISPPTRFDVKAKPQVPKPFAIRSGKMNSNVTVTRRKEVSNRFDVKNDVASNIVSETKDVEDVADQLDGSGSSKEKLYLQENGDTGNCHGKDISMVSSEGSSADAIDEEEANVEAAIKPFNYLMKVPRCDDRSLQEQINLAKLQVDEKTKLRNAIQVQIQEKRADIQIHRLDYEYAKDEDGKARRLVKSKRMEIDSFRSVISKAKNALSIEDINRRIHKMEHIIQHETLPLKQEKQLIREIKQLEQFREQLLANLGSQDEIRQTLEHRDEAEERLKILRKELDILKDSVVRAEAAAVEAEKKYDAENKKIKELHAKFRAANDVRQAAYGQLQSLRKKLSVKNKHLFKYKDDAAAANNYAYNGNKKALYSLCKNQVENFMELWNTNEEFRRDYVKFNARSTLRRLGTLDGHSLGPGEKPPVLPSYAHERVDRMISTPANINLASQIPTLELKQERSVKNATSDDKLLKRTAEHKNQKVTNKKSTEPALKNGFVMLSGRDVSDEIQEEAELTKKAKKTLRREEVEAKMKEQCRLEELAKAEVAREKKKLQAEKVQMREELKAQKEAEEKEKKRLKRLKKKERKKEKKKAAAIDVSDINNCETVPNSEETSKDVEIKNVSSVIPKKPQKPQTATKTKSVPPPMRNRNKKIYRQWMWTGLIGLVVYILFWLGNVGVLSKLSVDWRSRLQW